MASKSRATVFVVLESSFYDPPSGIRTLFPLFLKSPRVSPSGHLRKVLKRFIPPHLTTEGVNNSGPRERHRKGT